MKPSFFLCAFQNCTALCESAAISIAYLYIQNYMWDLSNEVLCDILPKEDSEL